MISPETTLRAIALEQPATIRVFEYFHLDYCCGGNRPLAQACLEKGIVAETVLTSLQQAIGGEPGPAVNLEAATQARLIQHIFETHHAFIRTELPRLQFMAQKVAGKHGPNHPAVLIIQRNLEQLAGELLMHLQKEETILFPYIEALERNREGEPMPHACFGTVESPIKMMITEHEGAAALLEEMHNATGGFMPWAGACPTSTGLYYGVAEFERDLHRHVHLENNLLFPRALTMERELLAAR